MEHWRTLRKGSVPVYLEYGYTYTSNLTAGNVRLRIGQHLELGLDLEENLRTRVKGTNSFLDARSLADGELTYLRFIQIEDSDLSPQIAQHLQGCTVSLQDVTLVIDLEKTWSFTVEVEQPKGPWLALRVRSPRQVDAPETQDCIRQIL